MLFHLILHVGKEKKHTDYLNNWSERKQTSLMSKISLPKMSNSYFKQATKKYEKFRFIGH